MDFSTAHAVPVAITIDDTKYSIPRFLMPALKEWVAVLIKQQIDSATKDLKEEDRARFLMYYQTPVFDIAALIQHARTPEGAAYVVDTQLKVAEVPGDVRAKLIANGDPAKIRALATMLTSADDLLASLGVSDTETKPPNGMAPDAGKQNPLTSPGGESKDSQETGEPKEPASAPLTA